jgi:hypothetical protein
VVTPEILFRVFTVENVVRPEDDIHGIRGKPLSFCGLALEPIAIVVGE